jgi:hypothetical protein
MRSLPESLQKKLSQQMQTVHNDADPRMEVVVARARTEVVDYTYWTVETIRETSGLGDISVAPRRFRPYGPPNRIYEIHVHNGEVKTAIREYPDRLKDGWKDQFSLGAGSSVAIAFNGEWQRYRKLFRLITEEKPYVSWVDGNGDLWVQKWDEHDTKFQLSSGVSKVRMIRAWKNTAIHYLDQGIVVAYIKTDGKVYYRNYCIQEDYTEVWESEKELTDFTGTAVNVNLFITNDYRMGFVIEDSLGQVHWLVTPRNWGGMASPAEHLATSIKDITFEVTPIAYHDTYSDEHIESSIAIERFYVCPADVVPEIVGTERLSFLDKKTIQVMFNYDLECELDNLKASLTLTNAALQPFTIETVEEAGNVLTIKTVEEMPFAQYVILTYNMVGSYYLAFRISSTCLYDYGNSINLTIDGVPPVGFTEENLEVAVTDIVFDVTQVYYSNAYDGGENIETSIVDISFVVTKVGHDPL